MTRVQTLFVAAAAALIAPAIGHAQFGVPVGPQSTIWSDFTSAPPATIAAGRDGESVAVWVSPPAASAGGVAVQRFAADGSVLSSRQRIEVIDWSNESVLNPAATIDAQGIATIVWEVHRNGDAGDIRAARIDRDGQIVTPPFTVNTTTAGAQTLPSVASDTLNHVLITWTAPVGGAQHGVFGQLLHGAGGFQFGEARVDEFGAWQPVRSTALMGDCCDVSVAWSVGTTPYQSVRARNFSLNWSALTAESSLIDTGSSPDFAAAIDYSGAMTVAWMSGSHSVSTQRFDRNLQPLSAATSLYLSMPPAEDSPLHLAVDQTGRAVLAWRRQDYDRQRSVLVHTDESGQLQVERTLFTELEPAPTTIHALAGDADGDVVLLWETGALWSPTNSLTAARFGGMPNVEAIVAGDYNAAIVEPGSAFQYAPRIVTTDDAAHSDSAIGILTAARYELDLDDAFAVEALQDGPGWQCESAATIVCRKARVERGSDESPVELTLRAPTAAASLTNQFALTHLETGVFPEFEQGSQTITLGDRTPDPFVFASQSGVARNSVAESETIVLGGFDTPTDLSVDVGDVSINGGAYTCCFAEVQPGSSVRLRHSTPSTFSTPRTTTLTIGGVTATFTSTTVAADTTPDAFAFADRNPVARGSVQVSNAITIAGINSPAPISVSGGEYRINGGAFTSATGSVGQGAIIEVRHTSAAAFSTATHTTLSIGGVSDTFTTTTEAIDTAPDAFAFTDRSGLATNLVVTSNAVTVTGINAAAPISISGGSYSINGAAFTATSGSVNAGDQVVVRVTTASAANTAVAASLGIGGVTDTFSASTGSIDSTPNAFAFTDVVDSRRSRPTTSGSVVITGINSSVAVSVSGNGVAWSKNGGKFSAAPGTVVNGDSIRLQMTSSANPSTRVDGVVTVGGIADTWSITTGTR